MSQVLRVAPHVRYGTWPDFALITAAGIGVRRSRRFERLLLLRAGRDLITVLPISMGHAVDVLTSLIVVKRNAVQFGFGTIPFGQTIAAETGQVHQIDVLYVGAVL